MSEPTPTPTREDRAAQREAARDAEKREIEVAEKQQATQRATALRDLENGALTLAQRAAAAGIDWPTAADALERVTAAARALAGKK